MSNPPKIFFLIPGGRHNAKRDQERRHRFYRSSKAHQKSCPESTNERRASASGKLDAVVLNLFDYQSRLQIFQTFWSRWHGMGI